MKAASLKQIRDEIKQLPARDMENLLDKILKSKKENKEMATYFLCYHF